MAAPAQAVAQNLVDAGYDITPIAPWPESGEWTGRIDQELLGFRRDLHHQFLLGGFAARAVRIEHAGRAAGYAYISAQGRVSRAPHELCAARNCTRDEGGPFEFGDQEPISSHRKLLRTKAVVVSVAEKLGQDLGRHGRERRAQANRCRSVESGLGDVRTGG
jgi:hypothetical protein